MLGKAERMTDTGTPARWRRTLFWVIVLISLVVLFAPAPAVPAGPDDVDKIIHVGLFAALAASGRYAGLPRLWLVPALVVYATASEMLQTLPLLGRSGSTADWRADVVGIALGYLAHAGAVAAIRARSASTFSGRSG
jgi:VanZ family protein